ncbi:sialin-like [Convolutriloba macropyga]|uniref:sialin-like n=1 Tax=Convolutriloba macropyga TaxID=536237 RepID=UPI003F52797C
MDKRDLFVSAISLNPIQITIEHKMHGPKCISYFATPPEHSLKPKAVSSTTGDSLKTGTFDWTASQQANLLSAFFYGYTFTQLPGGYFASKNNGKNLFGWALLIRAILLISNPLVAFYGGVQLLCFVRSLEGAAEGVTWPTIQHLAGRWAPENERSFYSGFMVSGASIGIMLTYPIVGLFCTVDLLDGWPLAFFFYGFLGGVWFIFWMVIASDSPDNHPRISESEKRDITEPNNFESEHDIKVPWKEIFSSLPFLGTVISETTQNVVDYGIMTCLPLYFANVLNFDIYENGLCNSLPWLASVFGTLIVSRLADFLLTRNYVTTTFTRKLIQFMASCGSAIFLVLAGYAGCNATLAVFCISMAMFFYGFRYPGSYCNILDIVPYFAGITFGITNTFGAVAGILAPVIVEKITDANLHSKELWLYSFYFIGAVSVFGGIFFVILASGEVQPWGIRKYRENQLNDSNVRDIRMQE